jgi:hypothetical protein
MAVTSRAPSSTSRASHGRGSSLTLGKILPMPKNIPSVLLESITEKSVTALRDIGQVHLFRFVEDASTALQSGGVLIAVAPNKDKDDGDTFHCLVGLPRGAKVTPWLSRYFS